jgi:hypothetical protein
MSGAGYLPPSTGESLQKQNPAMVPIIRDKIILESGDIRSRNYIAGSQGWRLTPTAFEYGGWAQTEGTWSYASADSPAFTITTPGDLSSMISAGMRVKITQATTKYFIVTKVSYSSSTNVTTVTLYGGTDYTLTSAAITSQAISSAKAPVGFPLEREKWTVLVTDDTRRTQTSPTTNTWYNIGSTAHQISVPIGSWELSYKARVWIQLGATETTGYLQITLSTTNNSETDPELSNGSYLTVSAAGAAAKGIMTPIHVSKNLTVTSKTLYYLNAKTDFATDVDYISFYTNDTSFTARTVIKAVCAYL